MNVCSRGTKILHVNWRTKSKPAILSPLFIPLIYKAHIGPLSIYTLFSLYMGRIMPPTVKPNLSSAQTKAIFASNLNRLVANSGRKKKELASLFDTEPRTFRKWRDPNDPLWPPHYILPKIASEFDCSMDDLFGHNPAWLPQTAGERELLMVVRQSNPNLPRRQIINALTLALGNLNAEHRKLWLAVGATFSGLDK